MSNSARHRSIAMVRDFISSKLFIILTIIIVILTIVIILIVITIYVNNVHIHVINVVHLIYVHRVYLVSYWVAHVLIIVYLAPTLILKQ